MLQLGLAFFASGFAALLCQVVWQRMLGLFAGSDTVSAALVVGAFLTGLGIGTVLGARVADRLSRAQAIAAFAACETGVALFALVSKYFLYDWLALEMAGTVDSLTGVFALCFAGLVLPTTLMGASLPLLSRAVATSIEALPARIALLYGLNTVGAGMGALIGGWVIIGTLGFEVSLRVAALLEVVAAALALTLIPAMRRTPDPAAAAPAERQIDTPDGVGSVALWCALAFASGFVIVALEIVWVRVIGQFGQYHAYMFATLLGVFLLADGAGIAVGGRLVRRVRDPRPGFFLAQGSGFLLALLLLLVMWWSVPHMPSGEVPTWTDTTRLGGNELLFGIAVTVLLIAPPSFLIGLTFPFIQRAVQRDLAQVGARVGWVQLANILGNAAGSLGTGLVALHLLGTAGTLVLLTLVTIGLLLLWLLRGGRSNRAGWAMLAAVVAALALVPGNDAWWRRLHVEKPGQPVAWAEDRSGVAFFRDDSGVPERARSEAGLNGANPFYIQGFSQGTIPFLPQSSQSGVLYSAEFLTQVRERLAPGGLYVQWAPTQRSAETFVAVFPHVVMLLPVSIMIGSKDPIAFDRDALMARLASPDVAAHLALGRAGCCNWAAMTSEPARLWTPGEPRAPAPLTDLFPRDEFHLNRQ